MQGKEVTGRFAPSPSGRMHAGNLLTALVSYLSAKSAGGRWILRIEDIDRQRSKAEHEERIKDDLLWLGLEWDEEYRQSERFDLYESALARIRETGLAYACTCTRADIMVSSAPHASDGRILYGGRCRPARMPAPWREPCGPAAVRLAVGEREVAFDDLICGERRYRLAEECGDFVLRRADGAWAYQLAVVVDDATMGVTEVVRGNDLLGSTAQQLYLYDLLGYAPPRFAHLPLVCNDRGLRLSKRDGDMSMEYLRPRLSPAELLGRLALTAGLIGEYRPCTPGELTEIFDMNFITCKKSCNFASI